MIRFVCSQCGKPDDETGVSYLRSAACVQCGWHGWIARATIDPQGNATIHPADQPITPGEIAEARRLAAAATPGPWRAPNTWVYGHDCLVAECGGPDERSSMSGPRWLADAAFIAFWRSFGPRLLDDYEEVVRLVDRCDADWDAKWDAHCKLRHQDTDVLARRVEATERERDEARAALDHERAHSADAAHNLALAEAVVDVARRVAPGVHDAEDYCYCVPCLLHAAVAAYDTGRRT